MQIENKKCHVSHVTSVTGTMLDYAKRLTSSDNFFCTLQFTCLCIQTHPVLTLHP